MKIEQVERLEMNSKRPIFQVEIRKDLWVYIQENENRDGLLVQIYVPDKWMKTLAEK